ncbi:hypothetical protein DPMN_003866 [Dreissena polymorpha]|uniref:Uncharacterized protein n=1 Tax=Dreissena polymorpha TaxID=45954 RepID=A0A9D4MPP9_DREPO|nr:hypothetical protein DPMN_003866 [Dreissena polymorpha]
MMMMRKRRGSINHIVGILFTSCLPARPPARPPASPPARPPASPPARPPARPPAWFVIQVNLAVRDLRHQSLKSKIKTNFISRI